MKKIVAAITMACLALCYYNVDAAKKKNRNKGNNVTQVVDKQNNESTSKKARKNKKNKSNQKKVQNDDSEDDDGYEGDKEFRSTNNKKRKYTPLLDQVSDSESETEYETAEEDSDDEIPADHKKKQKKVMKELKNKTDKRTYAEVVAGKKRKREDFDDETTSKRLKVQEDEEEDTPSEPPAYTKSKITPSAPREEDVFPRNKETNLTQEDSTIELDEEDDAETPTEISEKSLKKRIKEVIGELESEEDEKEAISKVSKILNVPEEFLVIPQTTYGEEGKKKIRLINPQNSQIPNRSLLVVFKEYEQKLKGILSTYVIPAALKDNAKTKAKKQAYYKKSGELYDLKKHQKIETYYRMPSKEKILSRIENISEVSEEDEED